MRRMGLPGADFLAAAITPLRALLKESEIEDDKVIGHLDDERVVGSTAGEPHSRCKRSHVYMLESSIFPMARRRGVQPVTMRRPTSS